MMKDARRNENEEKMTKNYECWQKKVEEKYDGDEKKKMSNEANKQMRIRQREK